MKRAGAAVAALACMLAPSAHAFTLEQVETRFHEERYELTLRASLAAPLQDVMQVLRDYERYPMLDERVETAHVLERVDATRVLLHTEVEACVSILCHTVERVEEVTEGDTELTAIVIADRSDVTFGRTHTRLERVDEQHTRVIYETSVAPRFWVPKFARRAMLNSLKDGTIELFTELERVAQQHAATERPE